MISISNDESNIIEAVVEGILQAKDFDKLARVADDLIRKHNKVCVLVDASNFDGWEDMDATEKHFNFVKEHHQKVQRLAIIAGHRWQHWLAAIVRVFVHPEVRVFDQGDVEDAREWVRG